MSSPLIVDSLKTSGDGLCVRKSHLGFIFLPLLLAGCAASPVPATAPTQAQSSEKQRQTEERLAALERRLARLEDKQAEAGARLTRTDDRLDELEQQPRPAPKPSRPSGRKRPDPAKVYAVPIAGSPSLGRKDAYVTMVMAYEFGPFVDRVGPTLDQLRKEYGRNLRIVYRPFNIWPRTRRLLLGVCAAHKQKRFKAMYDQLFKRGFRNGVFSDDVVLESARAAKLNMRRFRRDWKGGACEQHLKDSQASLKQVGTSGTPSFHINGRFLTGARPIDQFRTLIDEELAKARASGVKRRSYYQKRVLDRGLRSVK